MKFFISFFFIFLFFVSGGIAQQQDLALKSEKKGRRKNSKIISNEKLETEPESINNNTLSEFNHLTNPSQKTNFTLNDFIEVAPLPGASNYYVLFENLETGKKQKYFRGSTNKTIQLNRITGIDYGNSYQLKLFSFIGGAWIVSIDSFNISISSTLPVISLDDTFCGSTGIDLNQKLFSNYSGDVSEYHWAIENTELKYFAEKHFFAHDNSIQLKEFEGLKEGYTYFIKVRARINDLWTDFGEVCSITIENHIPSIQNDGNNLNKIYLTKGQFIFCNKVTEATSYQWVIKENKTNKEYTFTNSNSSFFINEIAGLTNNSTYTIKVRTKIKDNWQSFGPEALVCISDSEFIEYNENQGNYIENKINSLENIRQNEALSQNILTNNETEDNRSRIRKNNLNDN